MDLIRTAIKSLLYDFPQEVLADYIINGDYRNNADFYSLLKELISWRENGFSQSEVSLLEGIMSGIWLVDDEMGFPKDAFYHPFERIFLLLDKCSKDILDVNKRHPKVRMRHLLRWRDLTLLVGEDNLILPHLARIDLIKNFNRTEFLWPNILEHDDVQLNGILDEMLSDTHFHLNAGCDVFEFNWIIIMNHVEALDSREAGVFKSGERRVYNPVSRYSEINLTLVDWIRVAAFIRASLFAFVLRKEKIEEQGVDVNTLFDYKDMNTISVATRRIIESFRRDAVKTSNDIILDYAIMNDSVANLSLSDISNVYMVHHGERFLLYEYFKQYFSGNESARRYAPMAFLYVLIKNKLRRELIQTNGLRGFENFQNYQRLKSIFFNSFDESESIRELAFRYSIQSAAGSQKLHNVEARVTPKELIKYQQLDYTRSVFGNTKVISEGDRLIVTLVCHFIKSQDKNKSDDVRRLRHKKLRNDLKKCDRIISDAWNNNKIGPAFTKFVGIDAASSELICRPEVFAPVYEMSRNIGIPNFTYHVGEDFYDVVDGLRAIYEAVEFLNLSSGARIGHAIALGIDVRHYYSKRHNYIIISKQDLLDNLVWMKYMAMSKNIRIQPKTELLIDNYYAKLMDEIGYSTHGFVPDSKYWKSMCDRYRDPLTDKLNTDNSDSDCLLDLYWYDSSIRKNGSEAVTERIPESYVEDVRLIQIAMYADIERRGIFIETNPTSNLHIGGFERYIDLPIFRFHTLDEGGPKLPVSINTDDKGVFATSLKNEFSLIAAALRKEKKDDGERRWHDKQIMSYIRRIAYYGNLSRFTI